VLEDRTVPANINWTYNFTPAQSFVASDSGSGTVLFTNEPTTKAINSSDVVVTNLRVISNAAPDSPDTLTHGVWADSLVLTDDASQVSDTMTFTGELSGNFSASNANIANVFTGPTTQTATLGSNKYTVSLVGYLPPGPPTASNVGSISVFVQVAPAGQISSTTTEANDTTTTFSTSEQDVTLTADVKSSGGAVDEGTVTFTIMQGGTVIGTATTSGTVNNGAASVSYLLPGGTPVGSYAIDATYSGGPDFSGSSDNTRTLTVSAAPTTISASGATTDFSSSQQNVSLTANVTSSAGPVNEGTVTFTIMQGTTVIGTATTSGTVNNGAASVSYLLPGGTPVGSYTIDAIYIAGSDFSGSSDNTHDLTLAAVSSPSLPPSSRPAPPPPSPPLSLLPRPGDYLALFQTQFILTLDSTVSLVLSFVHFSNPELDNLIAVLQQDIDANPAIDTPAGDLAVSWGASSAVLMLTR
jgi:hypothetical protein